MVYACEICGKKSAVGRSQKHRRGVAGKRWRKKTQAVSRTFKPNLQRATLNISGKEKKMRICAKCLKKIKKDGKVKDFSNIKVA